MVLRRQQGPLNGVSQVVLIYCVVPTRGDVHVDEFQAGSSSLFGIGNYNAEKIGEVNYSADNQSFLLGQYNAKVSQLVPNARGGEMTDSLPRAGGFCASRPKTGAVLNNRVLHLSHK